MLQEQNGWWCCHWNGSQYNVANSSDGAEFGNLMSHAKSKSSFGDSVETQYRSGTWQFAGLRFDMSLVEDASCWLVDRFCSEKAENLLTIAQVLWEIWSSKNRKVWEDKTVSAEVAIECSSNWITEWQSARAKRTSTGANVYLVAVLKYLAAKVLELGGNAARDNKKNKIIPRYLLLAIRNDEKLGNCWEE